MNYRNPEQSRFLLALLVFAALLSQQSLASLADAEELFQRGQYLQAAEYYLQLRGAQRSAGVVGASRSYALSGQRERAIEVARDALKHGDDPHIATQLAEVLFASGRSDEALRVLAAVAEGPDPPLRALVKYGEFLRYRGHEEDASAYLSAALVQASVAAHPDSESTALQARAQWLLGDVREASNLFRRATQMEPRNHEAQVWWGDLFAEKYNDAEALRSYRKVLEYNRYHLPAIVRYARLSRDRQFLQQALYVDPQSPEAFLAYADLALEKNQFDEAKSYLDAALPGNPESLGAIAAMAAIAKLQDREEDYREWQSRALSLRPNNAEFYTRIAEIHGHAYRFREAVEFARKAIAAGDDYWPAYTALGTNLARLGQEEEGRAQLEIAFDNDPYHIWNSNLLKVFDTLDGFVNLESEHFIARMSERDAQVLWPYMEPLLEEAWTKMVDKYGFEPEAPILIEVFDKQEDFAVRSVGLPDLGPLVGICFGNLITLISPDTLAANWQEIVWHELVHVVTLQMTENRIPRWLSEGISVYEEFQARPEWGRRQELDILRALNEGRIKAIEQIDDAFLDARSAEELGLAYLQSWLVVEYIVAEHGFAKLRELIKAYRRPEPGKILIAEVFSAPVEEFNEGFNNWLRDLLAETDVYVHREDNPDEGEAHGHGARSNSSAMLAELYNAETIKNHMQKRVERNPRDFQAHLQLGIVFLKEKDHRLAERHLKTAKSILPHYSAHPSPPRLLAQLYSDQGKEEEYWQELEYLARYDQHDFETPMKLARRAVDAEDLETAEYYLQRAIAVNPYRLDVHRVYAELAEAREMFDISIREHRIISFLDKSDPVDSHTRLARAYLRGGQAAEARHHSLLALELAPTYRPAQAVLLEVLEQ